MLFVIRRLYVHNFRCLENFELSISDESSVLLIGKNGSGKSTVLSAFEILQKIARGTNQVASLVSTEDFSLGRRGVPMRFAIDVELGRKLYQYILNLELPSGEQELSVSNEMLSVDRKPIYARYRHEVQVEFADTFDGNRSIPIGWRLAALPIMQEQSSEDPLFLFRQWLARSLILRPIPPLISGDSTEQSLLPSADVVNFGAWFTGLVTEYPGAYSKIEAYLRQIIPDLDGIQNPLIGKDSRSLLIRFSKDKASFGIPFQDLSDGEKCFIICAMVLAANEAYGPLVCFWDEPDNYLALDEVGHFVMALRKAFKSGGQLIATSHNPEAIRAFSDENTLLLHREDHFSPATIRPLSQLQIHGDLVNALIRGGIEP